MLTLYGTSACHLCELAEAMLVQVGAAFEKVDISDDDALFERYGVLIPVVRREDGRELHWPFPEQGLADFVAGG